MERILIYDEMTPKERDKALSEGNDIDRIPICPIIGEAATAYIGTTVSEFTRSSELMAEMEINSYKKFGHDGIGVGPDLFGVAEAMGTVLGFPENDIPYVKEPVLKDYNDLDKLSPVDPYKDGRLPIFIEALKKIQNAVGHEVFVGSSLGGPFTTAASIRGTEQFLRDLRKNPEGVHKLLRLATESAFRYIDAVSAIGVKPDIAEPIGSSTLISAKQFEVFVKPYLKMYGKRIREKCGSYPALHICGNTQPIWEHMADTGAETISLDNVVDLEEAKNRVGNRVCIMGNVKPIETMKDGSKEDVLNEVKECFKKAYDSPKGFILSTGCQLPMNTPIENVMHFMEAGRKFGKWPLDPKNWQ